MILFIVRGLPGSGKTTLAHNICDNVYSADDYFMVNGEYQFDQSKLPNAHKSCFDKVEAAMIAKSNVCVANTFTRAWEFKQYHDLATKYGYMVHQIIVENTHGNESIHSVPSEAVERMRQRFEVNL